MLAGSRGWGWFDPALEEAVTNMLVRQKHTSWARPKPGLTDYEPIGGQAIAERVARFSREDVRSVSWLRRFF